MASGDFGSFIVRVREMFFANRQLLRGGTAQTLLLFLFRSGRCVNLDCFFLGCVQCEFSNFSLIFGLRFGVAEASPASILVVLHAA